MNKMKSIVLSLAFVLGMGVLYAAPAGAINVFDGCTGANAKTSVCNAESRDDAPTLVRAVINVLLYAIGVISVIMIIIGGIRYATSDGDSSKITSAKNTVLYSVIGLIVALLSFAIVNFVVNWF